MPSGHAANQMRKAITIAELLHEAGVSVQQAIDANAETKAICSQAAQLILKTQKAKQISDETWGMVCSALQHAYDQDRKDCFAGIFSVEPR